MTVTGFLMVDRNAGGEAGTPGEKTAAFPKSVTDLHRHPARWRDG